MENAPEIFWGFDELYLEGMQIGCNGAVGSSYNFAAPIYHRVLDALSSRNMDEAGEGGEEYRGDHLFWLSSRREENHAVDWCGLRPGAAAAGQPLRSKTGLGRFFRVDR